METKEELVGRLDDAIAGLKRISPASVLHDSEAYEHFFKTMLWLQAIKAVLEGNSTDNNPLIDTDLKIQVASEIVRLEAEIDGVFASVDAAALEHHDAEKLEYFLGEQHEKAQTLIQARERLIGFMQDKSGDVRLLIDTVFEQPTPVAH